ncbi:Methyl-accepting chemotaxis protein III [BD1-7 clade bacterium]|uniref:Methyl-accepting chemotaxis protein III n=1 Tax=BD1-7 clade bacterium TaxID=2029982 RepID=A0A5S9Q1R8_9GAMM|nr:Methyl-accepting chemotaxis protein III [BD1-7 clade bacterium]CAA0112340.1 Methyl-accepting chemotaxis protein III [BD1-7 clade bacterium]
MKLIDIFAAPQYRHDDDLLYKARFLVGITLAYLLVILTFALFFSLYPGMDLTERLAGVVPVSFVGVFFVVVLLILKHRGHFHLCAHMVVGVTLLGVGAGVFMSGGSVDTPSGEMIIMPVVLAFCMLGLKSGLFWAALVLLANSIGLVAALNGYQYPMVTGEELLDSVRVFNWLMGFATIVAIVVIYEVMNQRLKHERDSERDKYRRVAELAAESTVVNQTADSLAISGDQLLASTIEQKSAIQQLVVTTEELSATAEQNSRLAAEAMSAIKDTEVHMTISLNDIQQLLDTINKIKTSSGEIHNINGVINDLAYQTNLLSLNAMIEASRLGDGNGGFKVVALEVKKLAERSAEAAANINELLEQNLQSVQQGVTVSDTMRVRFDEIEARFIPLAEMVQNVYDASFEQNEAIRQIMVSVNDFDRSLENNQALAEGSSNMAGELRNNSASLSGILASLNLDQFDPTKDISADEKQYQAESA